MRKDYSKTFKHYFYEINPKSWEDAKRIGKRLCQDSLQYVFRGQASNEWGLQTSLERAAEKYADLGWTNILEQQIIEKFKARAHQYIPSPPNDQDNIEWLSTIQHYGGPTRLLDFSESFYIASFFAIDSAIEHSCVWAINETTLMNSVMNNMNLYRHPDARQTIDIAEDFMKDPLNEKNLVVRIVPSRLNERLAVQKGKFLFPCNAHNSFEGNLCSTFNFPFNTLESENATLMEAENIEEIISDIYIWPSVLKINISKDWYRESIRDLYAMNIDSASLFPGLEGFARSLNFIVQKDDLRNIPG